MSSLNSIFGMGNSVQGAVGKALGKKALGFSPAGLALQALPSVAGLMFGENSLFSGKARQASQKLMSDFQKSQATPIDSGYTDWYNRMQSMGNMGLSGATRGLMNESFARQQGSMMSGLRSKRSLLGGIGQVADAGNEFIKRQGEANENLLRQNRMAAADAAFKMAGIRTQDRLRKEDEARQFWGMRKAESNQSISRNLAGIGQAVGSQSYYSALNNSRP
jgi:hypothetical protein